MAERKGFVVYFDLIHTLRKMPKASVGELFLKMIRHGMGENTDVDEPDLLVDVVFEPVRHQMNRDLGKYDVKCEKNSKNGKLGGRPKTTPETKMADDYTFEMFWDAYAKKRGDIDKLKTKWSKISRADKALIKEYVPKYVAATPDVTYRKDPSTFLNNKSWHDAIISKNGTEKEEPYVVPNVR